ncbi:MAG: DUF1566 domain-containing protein [Candidatus Aminicenantes bacterium]|nr:DUF1566 domain-containing protein [Candidatus Aminicenantes bacterium]
MKIIIPFLILLFLFSTCLFSQERGFKAVRTPQGKEIILYKGSYALVVGNGKYTAGWDELLGAVEDAEEIADVLRRKGFRITLVKNADKKTFLAELGNFTYKYGQDEDNQLLFYYAGHGHTAALASGEELGYLVMVDAPLPEKNPQDFDSKSVDMKSIITWALKMRSKHVLFMFDSCFSGTILNLRDRVIPKAISDAVSYPVRQFITAGRAAEPVPDRSVFKQLLIDILEGKIEEPIKDGYITGEELGLFLKSKVPEYNKFQHPQYGKIRNPNLDKGDFVFVLESKNATTPVEGPKPVFPKKTKKLDLSSIEESTKLREEALRRWDDWQNKMNSDFRNVEGIDKKQVSTQEEKKAAWEQFLKHYEENNPYTTKDDELRQRAKQRIKELSKVKISVVGTRISLRSIPTSLTSTEVKSMLKRRGFFDSWWNVYSDFSNKYEATIINGEYVVIDQATGLMWHQSGSEKYMTLKKAEQWIAKLNRRGYSGYRDWRLPTLEEGASLLKRRKVKGDLYVDRLFSDRQSWIWTCDLVSRGGSVWSATVSRDRAWIVSFLAGGVYRGVRDGYVRPVRSGQK